MPFEKRTTFLRRSRWHAAAVAGHLHPRVSSPLSTASTRPVPTARSKKASRSERSSGRSKRYYFPRLTPRPTARTVRPSWSTHVAGPPGGSTGRAAWPRRPAGRRAFFSWLRDPRSGWRVSTHRRSNSAYDARDFASCSFPPISPIGATARRYARSSRSALFSAGPKLASMWWASRSVAR